MTMPSDLPFIMYLGLPGASNSHNPPNPNCEFLLALASPFPT
jgi:hypothetical protein